MEIETGLEGQRILITGASGGIGGAMAAAFAEQGCRLILHAGSREAELTSRVESEGWDAQVGCGDLRQPEVARDLIDLGLKHYGGVDICVANAGKWPKPPVRLADMDQDRVREIVEINLLGTLWTAQAFIAGLPQRKHVQTGIGASLCMIGSTAGRFGEAGHCDYAVSKAGMYGLLRTLKNEIVHSDPYARVNLLEPGWTVTEMAREALEQPGAIESALQSTPMQQLARPEDIARVALTLSSPYLSRHVSGQTVTVAGGMEGRVQWQKDEIDPDRVRAR